MPLLPFFKPKIEGMGGRDHAKALIHLSVDRELTSSEAQQLDPWNQLESMSLWGGFLQPNARFYFDRLSNFLDGITDARENARILGSSEDVFENLNAF